MQKVKSRVLSVIVALTMACALLVAAPVTAHAVGPDDTTACEVWSGVVDGDYAAATQLGGTGFTYSFNAALAQVEAGNGETIKLLKDIDIPGNLTIDLDGIISPVYHNTQFAIHTNGKILNIGGNLILVGDDAFLMIEAGGKTGLPDGEFNVAGDVYAGDLDPTDPYNMQWHNAAVVSHGATINIGGDVNSTANGVTSERGGKVTIAGRVQTLGYGVYASGTGSSITVGTPSDPTYISSGDFGVRAWNNATVTVHGDIDANSLDGDYAISNEALTYGGNTAATITINGNVTTAADGVWAYARLALTIIGDLDAAWTGVYADGDADGSLVGTSVTVTGNITAEDEDGVHASRGATVTVGGYIDASEIGVYVFGNDVTVTVNGDIFAGDIGILVVQWEGPTDNASVTTKDIYAGYIGVASWNATRSTINVNNIEAGYGGVDAWGDVKVFVNGNIVVTETVPFENDLIVGVSSANGGQVKVEGTITVSYGLESVFYIIAGWIPDGTGWLINVLEPGDNFEPSSLTGYLEYNDEDPALQDQVFSYVWVKDPKTLTPGTGDSTTLWLLVSALMITAIGTGCVLAYRKREQKA